MCPRAQLRPRQSCVRWALALSVVLLQLAVPLRLACADEAQPSDPRRQFELGLEAARKGDLARAAEHFESAQRMSPNPVVLYNLGQVYTALNRPIDAELTLQSYLATDPAPTPEREREIRELLRYNSRRIGVLRLEVTPADAELRIDGVLRAERSSPIRLAAGRHVVVATRLGYEPAILNVDVVAEGEHQTRMELKPEVAPPAASGANSKEKTPQRHDTALTQSHGSELVRPIALGVAGLGVATLGVGTVLAFQASGLNDDSNANGHCDASGCDDVGLRLRYSAMRKGDLATGFFVAGGALVAAGVSVYLFFPTQTPETARVRVSARSGGADVSVGVRFR